MTADAKAIALPLIEALREQLETIDNATANRLFFRAFLLDFGWDATFTDTQMERVRDFLGVSATIDALDEIGEALESGDPDVVALIGQSIAAVIEIVDRVNTWTSGNPGALPAPLDGSTNFWDIFPAALIDRLVGEGIEENLGPSFDILRLFGVAALEQVNPGGPSRVPFERLSLQWDRLGDMVTNPLGTLKGTIGWDQPGQNLDHGLLLDVLEALFFAADFPARRQVPSETALNRYYSPGNPARGNVRELVVPFVFQPGNGFGTVAELGFKLLPIPPAGNMGAAPVGLAISPVVRGTIQSTGGADDWELAILADTMADDVFRLNIRPSGADLDIDGSAVSVNVGLALRGRFDPPAILVGAEGSHRLEVEGLFLSAEARGSANAPEMIIRAGTGDGPNPPRLRFVFQAGDGDGFITKLVGSEPQIIDVGGHISFSSVAGIGISGTAGLQIQIPLHLSLGPIEFQNLNIGTRGLDTGGLALPLGLDIAADLGALQATISDIGAEMQLVPSDSGLFGNLDMEWAFKPPTGVGLAIDAGAVKGGGFLDIDVQRGEYAGGLELAILDIVHVTAIAIITTKNPDGSPGFSLLAAINVQFSPGIQLGFGFTLIGVGGLLGLNRSMDLDALVEGARSGSLDSLLFPEDLIANAARIISDMRAFFPQEEGTFLVGPMLKFGWGTPTLISLSIGIIIEVPGNIAIVGKLTIAIPDERAALIIIRVAFLGAIEFDKNRGWFFANIYDSRVVYMPLEGGIGVLADFGNNANFVVTVGDFHPAYNPPALPFPDISRVTISILDTPVARIRVEAYFAVTSNTVQFGARAELYFGISIAKIEGHIGFDALFQFSPFYFIIQISASLSVKLFGAGLFSVRFKGQLEGTSPWHVEGRGSISLLFWDVGVNFSKTWGEEKNTTLPPISVMPLLKEEYAKLENWTASVPKANALLVSLRDPDADALVLHPIGSLTITQRAVPLGITLDKFGNQRPDDANHFSIDVSSAGIEKTGTTQESFAIAQFQDKTDSEKLSASDFVKEEAGAELSITGKSVNSSFALKRIARYETIIIDNFFRRRVLRFFAPMAGLFTLFLGNNSMAKSVLSQKVETQLKPFSEKITVGQTGFVVANIKDNSAAAGQTFASKAQAEEFIRDAVAADASLAGQVHVIRPFEMTEAA